MVKIHSADELVFNSLGAIEFSATSYPYPFYYATGETIMLNCFIPKNYQFIHWVDPMDNILPIHDERVSVEIYTIHVSLTIRNASKSDEGTYKCIGSKSFIFLHLYS